MAEVHFTHVSKHYGETRVIEDLNLEIRDEELMVLVGPSGCGKSTALRMVAGLEEISGGTITIGGRIVNELAPKDRDIAMVFQNYALYPHMTVRENLAFGLRMRKTSRADTATAVNEAAEILGITPLLERTPKQLSGGQRQRVAVGRAIVRKPAVFLFDEPLSNLDARLRVQMRAEITRLQRRLKTTSIYVTHDQVEAMTMGNRIAVMNLGRLQQVGTPLDLYAQPVNLFVAKFIGLPPMNALPATVTGSSLQGEHFLLPLPESHQGLSDGRKVIVGIRPEHVLMEPSAPAATAPITAEVEIVEPIGHEAILHARVGAEPVVVVVKMQQLPAAGSRIELHVELDRIHLFDAATEARLAR